MNTTPGAQAPPNEPDTCAECEAFAKLWLATDEQIATLARHIANQAERILRGDAPRDDAERHLLSENVVTLAAWVR